MLKDGYIGLGIMGKPMARHILEAGFLLAVFNRSQLVIDELVSLGAEPGISPPGTISTRARGIFGTLARTIRSNGSASIPKWSNGRRTGITSLTVSQDPVLL